MILMVVLVYMVMASQFESYMGPLVIMLSIPFALIGVFFGLRVTGTALGSFIFLNAASHANASAVEQATLGTLGTLRAALSDGKCSAKIER